MAVENYIFLTIVFAVGVLALYRLFKMNNEALKIALNKDEDGKNILPRKLTVLIDMQCLWC